MPILLFAIALFVPRFVIFLLWLFTNWFEGVFSSFFIPILSFIFTPYTLLWYTVVFKYYDGEWRLFQIIFLIIALGFDVLPMRRHS